jgi:hypothetical protein
LGYEIDEKEDKRYIERLLRNPKDPSLPINYTYEEKSTKVYLDTSTPTRTKKSEKIG